MCRGKKGQSIVVSGAFIALVNHPKAMERRAGLLLLIFDESISCGGQCGYRRIKHTLSVPRKLGDECCSLA